MNQHQPSSGRAGSSVESGAGGIATKSHAAAETFERTVVEKAEQVRERADSARTQAAERIRRVSRQLRSVGETLRDEDEIAARLAEQVGGRIERVARYVNDTDARALIRDTEQLARREPALFFGGAFLLGLVAGRFIKSSRPALESSEMPRQSRAAYAPPLRESLEPDRMRSVGASGGSPGATPAAASVQNAQRYRENFDATFARDPAAPEPETSVDKTKSGLGNASGSPARNNGIAGNGGARAGKGSSP